MPPDRREVSPVRSVFLFGERFAKPQMPDETPQRVWVHAENASRFIVIASGFLPRPNDAIAARFSKSGMVDARQIGWRDRCQDALRQVFGKNAFRGSQP
jgi:hypothetical protein